MSTEAAPRYDAERHFHPATKEVVFVIGDREFRQRATLGVLRRVEEKHGAVVTLIGRLARREVTVTELLSLLALILRGHDGLPKGDTLDAAVEAVGLVETMAAVTAFLSYGLAADQPPSGQREGN